MTPPPRTAPDRALPIMEERPRRPNLVRWALKDARSYVRPLVRNVRFTAKGLYNDINRVLGTGRTIEEPPRERWRRVLRRSGRVLANLPPEDGPRVLIASAYGFSDVMMTVEPILAMGLRLRGASVTWLACDKSVPACEWTPFGNYVPNPGKHAPAETPRSQFDRCRVCTESIFEALGQLPLPSTTFQQYLRPGDLARATAIVDALRYEEYGGFHHDGIHVGDHAYASVMSIVRRGTLEDNERTRYLFRRYLISAVLVTELSVRLLDDVRPDAIVAMHGIYLIHGTFCEVARKRGVRVVVYGIPYRKGTIIVSHGDTYHRTLVSESNTQWEDLDLTGVRGGIVDDYLTSRRVGTSDNVSYNSNAVEDRDAIIRELDLDPTLPIIGMYTNVVWDAQIFYSFTAFPNMLEWVRETVRYFSTRPDLQLVIRIHPAELQGLVRTDQPVEGEVRRDFPVLPKNVRIIPASSRLSSYTLAEMSHASLIYGTKMGVEIAALGIPLIVAGEAFHRGKGYSYDVGTRADYFALLDRILDLPRNSPTMVERARKYAYHFFHRRMIDLPLFTVGDGFRLTGLKLTFRDLGALLPGRCASLDLVCQGIMDGVTPFVYDSIRDETAEVPAR